jgi:hypothetical protein
MLMYHITIAFKIVYETVAVQHDNERQKIQSFPIIRLRDIYNSLIVLSTAKKKFT